MFDDMVKWHAREHMITTIGNELPLRNGRSDTFIVYIPWQFKKRNCFVILTWPFSYHLTPPPKYSFPMSDNTLHSQTHRPYMLTLGAEQQVQSEAAKLRSGQMRLWKGNDTFRQLHTNICLQDKGGNVARQASNNALDSLTCSSLLQ